jgi:hypothetical protein
MREEIERKLKALKEEVEKLENFAKNEEQNPEGNTEYRYCVIREMAGYGTEDWDSLVEWAKRQKGYMYYTMDPDNEKEAFYFNAMPNALIALGLNRAGVHVCIDEKFCPRIIKTT